MPGTTIPRGNILDCKSFNITITPSAVLANTTAEQSFTVVGMQVGDYPDVTCAAAQPAGIVVCTTRVVNNNTLTITFANNTGGTLTPTAGSYQVINFGVELPNTQVDAT